MTLALSEYHVPEPPPGEDELPYDDGEPMETDRHRKQMGVLIEPIELEWQGRDDFYVGGNMAVYFSQLQVKKNDFRGPDVFVVLDTVRRERKSWVVWQEGRMPDVVIELLSPTTEDVDRGEKMRVYAKVLRVTHYYLFDPIDGRLEGYTLDPVKLDYTRMPPLPNGDLPCPRLGLCLGIRRGVHHGIEADWLRWLDKSGRILPTDEEQARTAQDQARAADERAADAERKLAEALAELERLRSKSG
jgi:Uma2 family endonuclease